MSLTIGAHSSIGMKGLLLFGTPEQKARYLPRLATGELIAAFCLTEPGAGSDAASIRTTAKRNDDGSWILNGEKIWITNGGIADLFTVFARTDGPEGKITAFIVETAWPGVTPRPARGQDGHPRLLDHDGRLRRRARAGRERARRGRQGLQGRDEHPEQRPHRPGRRRGRRDEGADPLAGRQAQERQQFGRPIAEFGLVRAKIAQMTVDCYAAESAVWMVAHYIDAGCEDYSVEAAISKVFASEAL